MGFRNTPVYVQRQIDGVLRSYKDYARAPVDEVVGFPATLEEHLHRLDKVFEEFTRLAILVKPGKAFLGSIVQLSTLWPRTG